MVLQPGLLTESQGKSAPTLAHKTDKRGREKTAIATLLEQITRAPGYGYVGGQLREVRPLASAIINAQLQVNI